MVLVEGGSFWYSEPSFFQFSVHGIDLDLVDLVADEPLHFERGCDDVVLHAERLQCQINLFGLLQTVELAECRKRLHLRLNQFLKAGVLFLENLLRFLACLSRILIQLFRFWHDNCHAAVLVRVTVDEALGNVVGLDVDVFKLFRGNILTLRQLENVLTAI